MLRYIAALLIVLFCVTTVEAGRPRYVRLHVNAGFGYGYAAYPYGFGMFNPTAGYYGYGGSLYPPGYIPNGVPIGSGYGNVRSPWPLGGGFDYNIPRDPTRRYYGY